MPNAASILKDVFGYDTFRPLQREVIDNILAHHDTLAVMPTGGGKSLCYQIPAMLMDGLTVVVSPLISLMKDQVEQMHAAGVPALFLNSTLSQEAYQANMEYVRRGEVKLLYLAPETLITPRIFSLLDSCKVSLLTIDEAHCISEWGHDFRPEYRQLVEVRKRYPQAVCMALTATATARVRMDIQTTLGFSSSNEFVASFNRENLYIEVARKLEPLKQTLRFLERFKDQSGIIYCLSRRQVDELAAGLLKRGYSVLPYHAGLTEDERRRNQEAFIRDDVQIIVATIAFGMGINKPNVRFVMHYDLPKSIEEYYQEIGRAGRDGLPASCLLLYSEGDIAKLRYFINQKKGKELKVAEEHLQAVVAYAEDEVTCRRKPLLNYFGEAYTAANCGNCDHCRSLGRYRASLTEPSIHVLPKAKLDQTVSEDITLPAQKFLSCVKRCGEKHGTDYIIDVLIGLGSERVLKHGHNKLSTFGIGADQSREFWQNLAAQLLALGYLKEYGKFQFATLSLTDTALQALRQRTPIIAQTLVPVEDSQTAESQPDQEEEFNRALFALLRQKRKLLADAEAVPPYVIFPDRTLIEMATYYPQTLHALRKIHGVGKVRLERFGKEFLGVIRPFCARHHLTEVQKGIGAVEKPAAKKESHASGRRTQELAEAYNAGQSLQGLADQYGVQLSTVLQHLTRFAQAGSSLRCGQDLQDLASAAPNLQQAALDALSESGSEFLKPVFEKLHGELSYEQLRALRLIYLCKKTAQSQQAH